ncbi:MAG TPA: FG-GAP-like repeat-containing protein, partial [Candidatus Limnocylindrales bacterium]|nr:FG-GAP-like repeat-containing protein [Candidatus Limnocylindrales bacterium]
MLRLLVGAVAASLVAGAAILGAATLLRPGATAAGAPHFVEEAAAAGVDHRYDGEFEFFVGGGVAVFDCDGDGRQDLYFAGGSEPAALFRNESAVGGALRFDRVVGASTDLERVTGAYPLDIDGDRETDLAVLRFGENVLLRGLGDCRFERGNESLGYDGGDDWTAAFSATWEGEAALPTLAFGNYLELDDGGEWTGACAPNELIRPAAEGPAYARPMHLEPSWCTLSML